MNFMLPSQQIIHSVTRDKLMSRIYQGPHRILQDQFETRRLADRLEAEDVMDALDEHARKFVSEASMFFLSTIDPDGQPTVSYKGGLPGFVRVLSESELAFPNYDGNGMYYSCGNIAENGKVGLLFIDFEKPNRLRLHGEARISHDDALLRQYPGAQFMVHVTLHNVFDNCPRYVHRMTLQEHSRFVPLPNGSAPRPKWKRLDYLQDDLSATERAQTDLEGGTVTLSDYMRGLERGEH